MSWQKSLQRSRLALLTAGLLLVAAQAAEAKREGFGFSKKLVNLNRLNPPAVVLAGTRLTVVGKAQERGHQEVAAQIAAKLGSEMVNYDPRLTLDDQRPQTLVEVTVLNDAYETDWISREGTRTEMIGKDSEGKKQYRTVNVTLRYQVVSHRFGVSYTVQDTGAKKTIYGDSLEISFKNEFQDGEGAPSQAERNSAAVQQTVAEIAYKLVPTPETIQVLVPKGSFEELVNLAEAGLWSRYSEAIESKSAFPSPADESYRQYALGLSYEAMGYGAENNETTLRYLEQAAQHYNSALSLNPGEDYFTEAYEGSGVGNFLRAVIVPGAAAAPRRVAPAPLQRVQAAMGKYQTLLNQKEEVESRGIAGAKALPGNGGSAAAAPPGLGNADVIAMVEGGVPTEIVLTSIDDAESCSFDTSPAGLIALTKAKVGTDVLKKIQSKSCN